MTQQLSTISGFSWRIVMLHLSVALHNFIPINRNSQLKSKHNLHNIFGNFCKLLYVKQINFQQFSLLAIMCRRSCRDRYL